MKKASFRKNHKNLEKWIDWYGNFLEKYLYILSLPEQYELLEAFVLRIATRWEVLIIQDTIIGLNHDSSKYSSEIGLDLKIHLTRDESEAILIGHRYIDFKGVGDVKSFAKKYLTDKFNPFKFIDNNISKKINQFFTIRNYLAHYSSFSKRKYKAMIIKDYKLRKTYEPGMFLLKIDKITKLYRWVEFIKVFLKASTLMKKVYL